MYPMLSSNLKFDTKFDKLNKSVTVDISIMPSVLLNTTINNFTECAQVGKEVKNRRKKTLITLVKFNINRTLFRKLDLS